MIDFEKFKKSGSFELTSGDTSSFYYDVKEAMGEPGLLDTMVEEIINKYNIDNNPFTTIVFTPIDVIIGMDYGGVPLAVCMSMLTNIPFAVIRKSTKEHGTKKRIEGYQKIGRAILLDDVKTTGNSLEEAKKYLVSLGYEIVLTEVVLDRGEIDKMARAKYENEYLY